MIYIKSFLKWAGGKNKLLPYFFENFPTPLFKNNMVYIEPFVGGGSVVFNLLYHYHLTNVYILDTNQELINCYKIIKNHVNDLIKSLQELNFNYSLAATLQDKEAIFTKYKTEFNELNAHDLVTKIRKAALFIFLNHTCFNGLYRVNSKNLFNVPFGKYLHPKICNEEHLSQLNKLLKHVHIYHASYKKITKIFSKIKQKPFIYLDPPYLASSNTKNFTSYTKNNFDLEDQIKLAKFLHAINHQCEFGLSNSYACLNHKELKELYSSFHINFVNTIHSISCNGNSRKEHTELFVTNYSIMQGTNHE